MTATTPAPSPNTRARHRKSGKVIAPGYKHLTKAQVAEHFRRWSIVKRNLVKFGGMSPQDAELERRKIYAAAGAPESTKDFKDRDLDRVWPAFASYDLMGDPKEKLRAIEQPRIRALAAIDDLRWQMNWTADTLVRAAGHFANVYEGPWQNWTELQLKAFLAHLTNKARAAKDHAADAGDDMPF